MATDQKIENLLNLALDATPEERAKSLVLDVGYDAAQREWEVIVKYSGSLQRLREQGFQITELSGGYALVILPQTAIAFLAEQPEIEYIEKPKRLFFSARQGRTASCMNILQLTNFPQGVPRPGGGQPLLGQGILVAVIDSGVDYTHPDFRNPDGSSRIFAIWDQSVPGSPPEGFALGTEYTKEQIDESLRSGVPLPTRDVSGHGTEVLGIAAGNGRASLRDAQNRPDAQQFGPERGVAPLAHILVVKLGNPREDAFPRTTELMQAIDYVYRKAEEFALPMAVNLSFGNVYGPHNGSGFLETYLTEMAWRGRSVVCVGTGNEGNTAGHTSGMMENGVTREIELGVAAFERTINVQLWKSYADEFDISIIHPSGQIIGPLPENLGAQRYTAGGTELLIFYGEPSPFSILQEIYIDFLPQREYIDSGIWRIRLTPRKIADGRFDMWLPQAEVLNQGTRFYRPSVENTLTIPSTARNIIAVGAYDSRSLAYAPFSGRGNEPQTDVLLGLFPVKPDLAAPGVDIRTTAVGGGYTTVSGTSFATPFVTGAAAMLMEYGIVNGNDPFLYGEKVRAYLIRGAQPLPGNDVYPNARVGWGEDVIIRSHR